MVKVRFRAFSEARRGGIFIFQSPIHRGGAPWGTAAFITMDGLLPEFPNILFSMLNTRLNAMGVPLCGFTLIRYSQSR
jgi:hypothetical protein